MTMTMNMSAVTQYITILAYSAPIRIKRMSMYKKHKAI